MLPFEIRPYEPGDEHDIVAAFRSAFTSAHPDFVPYTVSEWRWAYADNPLGMRAWVARVGDELAAHYASSPQRVVVDGEERIFSRVQHPLIDTVGAHACLRRGPEPYLETARRMLDATAGPAADLITYGWLAPSAWRIGRELLRYECVRTQTLLTYPLTSATPRNGIAHGCEVTEIDPGGDEIRPLYDECSVEWGASAIRDGAFLRWRFGDHPRRTYRILGVRDAAGALRGYAVYGALDQPTPASGWIADWLVPTREEDAGRALLRGVVRLGQADGAATIIATFPEWTPWFARFQEWGFLVRPSDYLTAIRECSPRHENDWLRDNWWYQPADMWLS